MNYGNRAKMWLGIYWINVGLCGHALISPLVAADLSLVDYDLTPAHTIALLFGLAGAVLILKCTLYCGRAAIIPPPIDSETHSGPPSRLSHMENCGARYDNGKRRLAWR